MRDTPHLIDSSTVIYFGEWSDFRLEFNAVKHQQGLPGKHRKLTVRDFILRGDSKV